MAKDARSRPARSPRAALPRLSFYDLANGPLGIVLGILVVVEAILGFVCRSRGLSPSDASFLIHSMVVLAFVTIAGFFVVLAWWPQKLYPPSYFRDQKHWLAAVIPSAIRVLRTTDDLKNSAVSPGRAEGEVLGLDVPATLQGSTLHFRVFYQTGFANGPVIANGILASCEHDYDYLASVFGFTPPVLPMNIIVKPEIGGAYHYGCDGVHLYCDGGTSANSNIDRTRALVVHVMTDVFQAASGRGWDCGTAAGDGLSRVLAAERYPTQLAEFVTAPVWLNEAARPDFVTNNETELNPRATGCAVLFLNYLHQQLGYTWAAIVAAPGVTLEETYRRLTGMSGGIRPFKALLQLHFPEGSLARLTSDNPFPL